MAKLKRDERLCPICAETIKAAAIRCRYCQAELTPVEAETAATPVVEPAKAVVEPAETVVEPAETVVEPQEGGAEPVETTPPTSSGVLASRRVTAILAAAALLAAAGVGTAWWRAEHSSAVTAPNGMLVGDAPRSEAVIAAADLTQRALSYDYRTLANDMEVARARMTPSFRKEYDDTMAQVRANTLKNKIVLQADAVSSSIIASTEHKARLLVFVNQTTSAQTTKAQQLDRNSLVVTLERGKGDWMLSELTALG
jgi:Mce-associated membrane protein